MEALRSSSFGCQLSKAGCRGKEHQKNKKKKRGLIALTSE